MHPAPNLVRLFSFVSSFPSPCLFPLNNILSKDEGRVVSCFPFWFLVYKLVKACRFSFFSFVMLYCILGLHIGLHIGMVWIGLIQ